MADHLRKVVEIHPQYPMLFFNLACCESLSGLTFAALDHLRRAIEMSEEFRLNAKNDSDLDALRDEPAFKTLVGDQNENASNTRAGCGTGCLRSGAD